MALITCPECGNPVSDTTTFCPNCGTRLIPPPVVNVPKESKSDKKLLIALVALLAVIVLAAGGGFGYYYYQLKKETERLEREKFVSDSIAQSFSDSIARVALMEKQREDSIKITRDLIISAYTMKLSDLNRLVARQFGEDASMKYFFLFDITKDGIPELWTKYGSCEADYELHVFTYDNGRAREIYSAGASHTGYCQGSDYILAVLGHMGYFRLTKITYDGRNVREKVTFEKEFGPDEDYPDIKEPYVTTFDFNNIQVIGQFIK